MVQNSNVCFIKGLHMHQNFIWKLFGHLRHIKSVQDFVLIAIYFAVSLLWFIEFGRIFELYKICWINQNLLTILQDRIFFPISLKLQVKNVLITGKPCYLPNFSLISKLVNNWGIFSETTVIPLPTLSFCFQKT